MMFTQLFDRLTGRKLRAGDTVEIKRGMYKGMTGRVVAVLEITVIVETDTLNHRHFDIPDVRRVR